MKKALFTCGFVCVGLIAFAQSDNSSDNTIQLKDLGVQPSSQNGPGIPDPPPPPPPSPLDQAVDTWKSIGQPEPILGDGKVGIQVTIPLGSDPQKDKE